MKKITNYILICTCALGFSSCVNTFLDLEPLDAKTDVIYFKTPEHFREYANGLYGQLLGWQSSYGSIFDHMDAASDLSTCFRYSYGVGTGVMGVPNVGVIAMVIFVPLITCLKEQFLPIQVI